MHMLLGLAAGGSGVYLQWGPAWSLMLMGLVFFTNGFFLKNQGKRPK